MSELRLGCTDLIQYHDRSESCNIGYTGYISNINLGYATLLHAAFKFHFGICHFPFWYIPLSILAYANYHSGICHFPFWHMPLSILAYATFHFGICNFPFWHMPLSNLGYVDHMSIKCKDIITNMKYLSQNIMKSVDLIKLIVAINSSCVHLYFVACLYSFISEKLNA